MSTIILKNRIKEYLLHHLSTHRYEHTLGVAKAARDLAVRYGADPDRTEMAGLLHDIAKERSLEEMQQLASQAFPEELDSAILSNRGLLHGYAAVTVARERYGIHDADILKAIAHHTTGATIMGIMEKIVFLADYIEVNREYDGVWALRQAAERDLDEAVLLGYDSTIGHLLDQKKTIYVGTVNNRNYHLQQMQQGKEHK
jgi:predicted HD superfamily hydrolase involved in NAD metabolism